MRAHTDMAYVLWNGIGRIERNAPVKRLHAVRAGLFRPRNIFTSGQARHLGGNDEVHIQLAVGGNVLAAAPQRAAGIVGDAPSRRVVEAAGRYASSRLCVTNTASFP